MTRAPDNSLFTPTEAAVLTRLPVKAVNNAIDKKTIPAVAGRRAGHATRLLDLRAPVSLTLERWLADRFGPELRREVFEALAAAPRNRVCLGGGLLTIDPRGPRRELAASLRELRRARDIMVSDPDVLGGSPVFPVRAAPASPRPAPGAEREKARQPSQIVSLSFTRLPWRPMRPTFRRRPAVPILWR